MRVVVAVIAGGSDRCLRCFCGLRRLVGDCPGCSAATERALCRFEYAGSSPDPARAFRNRKASGPWSTRLLTPSGRISPSSSVSLKRPAVRRSTITCCPSRVSRPARVRHVSAPPYSYVLTTQRCPAFLNLTTRVRKRPTWRQPLGLPSCGMITSARRSFDIEIACASPLRPTTMEATSMQLRMT